MSPVFVGSDSNDSKIRSNRIGFAVSTTDPGSFSAGEVYYNSTDSQMKVNDGSAWSPVQGSGSFEAVASGTLSDGSTVIINTDGTVSIVASTQTNISSGTSVDFESASVGSTAAAYVANSGKVVIAYQDGSNVYGKAIVGTVSGTNITFGTPVTFQSSGCYFIDITAVGGGTDNVIIAYREGSGGSVNGRAIVGTVSGTTINFATYATFLTANVPQISIAMGAQNNQFVIAYSNQASNSGQVVVGNINGVSLSYSSPTTFLSGSTPGATSTTYDSSNDKFVIAYNDSNSNQYYGKAVVCSVVGGSSNSAGSPSVGVPVTFNYDFTMYPVATFDSTNNYVIIAYKDNNNNGRGMACTGTVSSSSITFNTYDEFVNSSVNYLAISYDSSNQKVIIAYSDGTNSYYGTAIDGDVSNSGITYGTPTVFESASINYPWLAYDSANNKTIVSYQDVGNSSYGASSVLTPSGTSTNLTASNFIGFSDGAYTNGQTAKVQIVSSIDDAQVGLTTGSQYYVQTNGTLGTSAGSPSVFAGTALSDTQISVKL